MDAGLMLKGTLGPFTLEEVLGQGGMGVVYRAFDQVTGRHVAVKTLSPSTAGEEAIERFKTESGLLTRCRAPHVAAVYRAGRIEATDYIAMELMASTLEDRIARGQATTEELIAIGSQILLGLAAAHACGVIHRDVKPANVGVSTTGLIKLLDFGVATALPLPGTEILQTGCSSGLIVGSLPYMSPEQLRAEPTDARSDIYGTGAVLYELATGTRPFAGCRGAAAIDAVLHCAPERPSRLNPALDSAVEQAILRALSKSPARRFPSAFAMMDALLACRRTAPRRGPVAELRHVCGLHANA
jgi:serine/threonine kinase PknH